MRTLFVAIAILSAAGLASCGSISRPDGPVPLEPGVTLTRARDPRISANDEARDTALSLAFETRLAEGREMTVLALSGGGANGAFGAGVLAGWTERGDRPRFDIVTGVSTGALAAPFAFLGPDWDPQLHEAFTSGASSDLLSWRAFAAFINPSLFGSDNLRELVDQYVTPDLLAAVAAEHAEGRRLLIATTNLDNQETVIWDMGVLATQGDEGATELFKQVLVASASIPGVFPPVLIAGLDSQGQVMMEMHVDGGVNTPFLVIPENLLLWTRPNAGGASAGSIYVIVNGQVGRSEQPTPGELREILARTYDSMTKAQARTHLAVTAAFAERNGLQMEVAAIPDNVAVSSLRFDQPTMEALFELGRERARSGEAWISLNAEADDDPLVPENTAPETDVPEVLAPAEPEPDPELPSAPAVSAGEEAPQ